MESEVKYSTVCPDVTPEGILDWVAGYIKDGVFYPNGSVSEYYFKKQRAYNTNKVDNKTNIYFIQSEIGGPIKIGTAKDINQRLSTLQTGCPFKLMIINTINNVWHKKESELHKQFSKYRIHGEWFSPEIKNKIINL